MTNEELLQEMRESYEKTRVTFLKEIRSTERKMEETLYNYFFDVDAIMKQQKNHLNQMTTEDNNAIDAERGN